MLFIEIMYTINWLTISLLPSNTHKLWYPTQFLASVVLLQSGGSLIYARVLMLMKAMGISGSVGKFQLKVGCLCVFSVSEWCNWIEV